jgi:hypothetical protein
MTTVTEMAIKNVYEILIFRPTVGGEGGGAAERQQGRKAAIASTNMCGGILVLYLFSKFFYLKHSLIANNDVKT